MGKKNKRSSFSGNVDDFDEKIEVSASKDKKKKKHNISEANNVSFEDYGGFCFQDEQISNHSQTKKKSPKLLENNEQENGDLELGEVSDWSEEESQKLLDIIENMCNSKNTNKSYKVTLGKMKFDKVSNLMESNRTAEDCKHHFELIISKIKKVKSLNQVIAETRKIMSTGTATSEYRKTPYDLFYDDNKDKICSIARENKMNIFSIRSRLWNELPKEEKECYKEKAEKLKPLDKHVGIDDDYKNPVKSPFQFFLDKQRKKCPSLDFAKMRNKFTKMDVSKKLKFIKKSIETLYLEKEALMNYEEMYPERPTPKKIFYHYPSQEEVKYYYHHHLELPEMPPKSLPVFALKEAGLPYNNIMTAVATFKKFDMDIQQEWHLKFKKVWKDYIDQLSDWKSRQDPRDVELMEKWSFLSKLPKANPKKTKPVAIKKVVKKKVEKKKVVEKVFKEVVMPVNIKKFDNEPQMPPLSIMMVYDEFLKKQGEVVEKSDLKQKYNNLTEVEKERVQERAAYIRNKFIKRIKMYVSDMTDEMRKLYLGLKRKKLINALKEDIFEEIYPDEQYPVYVKQLTCSKIDKREQNKDISPSRKKGKRNLFPLENDMLDVEHQETSNSKSKLVEISETSSLYSEHLADSDFEPSPKKLKKRKKNSLSGNALTISPQKSKKIKTHKSSSSDFEDDENKIDNESSLKVKKNLGSNTPSTKSPQKSTRKSSETLSDSEDEGNKKLTPGKSQIFEDSSSEEEDVFETWHSNVSFNKSY